MLYRAVNGICRHEVMWLLVRIFGVLNDKIVFYNTGQANSFELKRIIAETEFLSLLENDSVRLCMQYQ